MNKSRPGPLFFRARFWPSAGPRSGETAIATWNLLSLFSNLPGVYKQPALPSARVRPSLRGPGAHYQAGPRARGGPDSIFKLSLSPGGIRVGA